MKFDFDKYKGKYAMQCETEEEAKEFCDVMHDAGRTWYSETSYLKYTNWVVCKGETVYYFNEGMCGNTHEVQDYTILEWSDFRKVKKEMTKKELKTGMVAECCNGSKRMVLLDTPAGDVLIGNGDSIDLYYYTNDLRSAIAGGFDIVAVYEPHHKREMNSLCWNEQKCIWRRSDVKEVTLSEIAEKFGVSVENIRVKE